eukprot:scaffold674_cov130-Amphora_coffeaeformis.AAC.14
MSKFMGLWKRSTSLLRSIDSLFVAHNDHVASVFDLSPRCTPLPRYESLCEKSMESLTMMLTEVDQLSFFSMWDCYNESERRSFYQNILKLLIATSHARMLSSQTTFSVDFSTIFEKTQGAIEVEMERIYKKLESHIEDFPREEELSRIFTLVGNLRSFIHVFERDHSVLSRFASDLLDKGTRSFNDVLERILSEWHFDSCCGELLDKLLLLKKASCEVLCWRNEVNRCIDKCLAKSIKCAPRPSDFLLDLSLELRKNLPKRDEHIAQQLLLDHKCFEGITNNIFDEATSGQDIEYVLNGLSLSPTDLNCLRDLYTSFECQYSEIILSGLANLRSHDGGHSSLLSLRDSILSIANDFTLIYADQVSALSAQIFAYWSLSFSNDFTKSSESSEDAQRYLMRPHPAQVIAVWLLVNANCQDFMSLESRLAEVKTGEGKSIILGVTAIILALLGCKVTCVCYSSFLSERDEKAFRSMFSSFGVSASITYGTVKDLHAPQVIGFDGAARDTIMGKTTKKDTFQKCGRLEPTRVLLVDEVDVLFSDDLFGSSINHLTALKSTKISTAIRFIWSHCEILCPADVSNYDELQQVIASFPPESHALISHEFKRMIAAAKSIKTALQPQYVCVDGRIMHKYFDGLQEWAGHDTLFAYLKESENGHVSQAELETHMYLRPHYASCSYAEFPLLFDVILGVTGTLRFLNDDQRQILSSMYEITTFNNIPSVYGENKLKFACRSVEDVVLCKQDDHSFGIKDEIRRRRQPRSKDTSVMRPVMIFFYSKEALLGFYNCPVMKSMKHDVRIITETASLSEREGLFLKATERGAITLMIREFGRGTDFKCFDRQVLKEGGVHVIQAFFSTDVSEEIQIKGRCARQGADGSFSMVLNAETVRRDFGIPTEDLIKWKEEKVLYVKLNKTRIDFWATRVSEMKEDVAQRLRSHTERDRTKRLEEKCKKSLHVGSGSDQATEDGDNHENRKTPKAIEASKAQLEQDRFSTSFHNCHGGGTSKTALAFEDWG